MQKERKKVYMDLEFTGLHQRTTPISIGLICENKSFYAEFLDFDSRQLDDWIMDNVIRKTAVFKGGLGTAGTPEMVEIDGDFTSVVGNNDKVARELSKWLHSLVEEGEQVEIWSDCLAYDWVVFCQLYKGAFNVPKCVYYIPMDICPLFPFINVDPDVSREEFAFPDGVPADAEKHNALWDAMVIQKCHERILAKMLYLLAPNLWNARPVEEL